MIFFLLSFVLGEDGYELTACFRKPDYFSTFFYLWQVFFRIFYCKTEKNLL